MTLVTNPLLAGTYLEDNKLDIADVGLCNHRHYGPPFLIFEVPKKKQRRLARQFEKGTYFEREIQTTRLILLRVL